MIVKIIIIMIIITVTITITISEMVTLDTHSRRKH